MDNVNFLIFTHLCIDYYLNSKTAICVESCDWSRSALGSMRQSFAVQGWGAAIAKGIFIVITFRNR